MTDNIQVFWGADARCGVTMLVQAMAESLARRQRKKKILVLHLSGAAGNDFAQTEFSSGLDDLQLKLSNRVLTATELESSCMKQDNLYFLKGTDDLILRRQYQPEDVAFLFAIARGAFDAILVDGGSAADQGLCIGALLHGDQRNLVTTQGQQALYRYTRKKNQILQNPHIGVRFDRLIINQFYTASYLAGKKELISEYQIDPALLVQYSGYGRQAENEKRLLTKLDREYARDIEQLVQTIFEIETDQRVKKRSILSLMRKWRS